LPHWKKRIVIMTEREAHCSADSSIQFPFC
jgi:hypothetical protein